MNAAKHIITVAFNKTGLWFLLTIVAVVFMNANQEVKTFNKPAPVGSYEYVLSHNTCEDTVEGEFPTGVVMYDLKYSGYVFSTKPVHIAKGLDEEFAGKTWKRYTVIHFCK